MSRVASDNSPRMSRALLLVLFAAVVAAAGTASLPPLDRDEARFVQATTQMLETGDFINIRFQDTERNKKPVGIYWLQAASVSLFSDVEAREIWAYRIPSFLAALLSALLAYRLGCCLFDEETAFFGTMLLVAAPSFSGEATIAKTDAALLTTVLATQLALARLYLDGFRNQNKASLGTVLLFWIAVSIGILIKGPITPMIAFLTVAFLTLIHLPLSIAGWRRMISWALSFRPVTGLLVMLMLVGPWMLAIGIETDGRFYTQALGTDMLGKIGEAQENHAGPFGYYLIVVWIMFWPAALLLPLALRYAAKNLRNPSVVFLLAWLVPSWLVFELASTKLPHYTLPLYPVLAFLVAFAVTGIFRDASNRTYPLARFTGTVIYLAVAALGAGVIVFAGNRFSAAGSGVWEYLLAGTTVVGAGICVSMLWQFRLKATLIACSLMGAVMAWVLYEGMLPRLDYFRMSPAISETLIESGLHPIYDAAPPVALLGYYEPSAIFLIGTDTINASPDKAAAWLKQQPGHIAIVESRWEESFLAALGDVPTRKLAVLKGYNYSNAIDVVLTLYISE